MDKKQERIGVILTLVAGILWGFSGTCGQYIFENFGADPQYLTAARLLSSGIILLVFGFIVNRDAMISIWKVRSSVSQLIIFAIAGLMFCQLSYMQAIANSNSGTATILQYMGPVLVMITSCFLNRRLPTAKETAAVVMVMIGTFLIATRGNIHELVITPKGLAWGIASAFALMLYTMLPVRIIKKHGSTPVTGFGMAIGGIVLSIYSGLWNAPIIHDFRCGLAVLAIVVFGTVIPFTMYLKGLSMCGAVKGSMVASIEPVSATLFMVLWLKVKLHPVELIGFVFILMTIFLLTKSEDKAQSS